MFRIGYSEDIHKKENGRKLILAGVYFPDEVGLEGHSDADVVTHAIAESILGALALGDLGKYFPDNDPKYQDISSLILLDKVVEKMKLANYVINNIDVQVCLKSPRLEKYILEMRKNVAKHLQTSLDCVSIKACSYNNVGYIGNGEAIKASSIVMLKKDL